MWSLLKVNNQDTRVTPVMLDQSDVIDDVPERRHWCRTGSTCCSGVLIVEFEQVNVSWHLALKIYLLFLVNSTWNKRSITRAAILQDRCFKHVLIMVYVSGIFTISLKKKGLLFLERIQVSNGHTTGFRNWWNVTSRKNRPQQ